MARLLKKRLKFSLKANRKTVDATQHPDRDQQFEYLASMKQQFARWGARPQSRQQEKKLVGTSHDRPDFASDALASRLELAAPMSYPGLQQLLIFSDKGASNCYRPHAWENALQKPSATRSNSQSRSVTIRPALRNGIP